MVVRAISRGDLVCVVLSLLVLAAAGVERISLLAPADATPYHRRVRDAGAKAPLSFGEWAGVDLPVPPEASSQLRPNVILSRRFQNAAPANRLPCYWCSARTRVI